MRQLKGKVVFITGGSRCMGASVAKRLSTKGTDVVFMHSAKNGQKANDVVNTLKQNGGKSVALVADNEDPNAIIAALELPLSAIDILVNNAGIYMQKPITEYSLDGFDQMMNVNVKAVFARHIKSNGRIITIGSHMADRVSFPGGTLYSMSKSAPIGLTKGMARDLGLRGITVNLTQPGPKNRQIQFSDHRRF